MTQWFSQELTGFLSLPVVKPTAVQYSANLVAYEASIVLQSQLVADTILYGVIPAGSVFQFGLLNTDTSLGTSTIALGIAGTTGKYHAAGTLTGVATDVFFNTPVAAFVNGAALTAQENDIVTVAVATLPASGNLVIRAYWGQSN